MASDESMLNATPGSLPVYAPGKETSTDEGGVTVPAPVTSNCAHSG